MTIQLNPPRKGKVKVKPPKAQPTHIFKEPNKSYLPKINIVKPSPSSQEEQPSTTSQEAQPYLPPERWLQLYRPVIEYWSAKAEGIDPVTARWIRNNSDLRAAQEGMRFSESRGQEVVDWIEGHCILYEGSKADTPLICEDWQYEYFMQLFGWHRFSQEIGRWIRRFTHAGIWIAKKNAKSPTLAATGLYMLIGDGEPGQKCYCVARDGKQAKIAHTHAVEMVKNSPLLMAECKINHTEGIIKHLPSKSEYKIVHADNSKSTEGFNGSLFCDETHVLEQAHMDRLKRAGISRDEPLHVEVSTAGDNSDGYGFNRYEYGRRLSMLDSPNDYNPHFLFIDFSIDQKVTLDKLRDQQFITNISTACNPALGRILRHEEFLSDWRDSLQSDTELRKFAMYRLNLWLKDSASWVELSDWLACSDSPLRKSIQADESVDRQFTLEDLRPYPCVVGLDLSKTLDMTALTLIFAVPDPELGVRPYTWTWHWLPKVTAERYQRYVDFFNPRYSPWLHIINQKTIDYETIASHLNWIRDSFDLRTVGYDAYNSNELVNLLINNYGWHEDLLIKVPQQMRILGPITKEVERWIVRREVHHADNSLLSWQFQHVQLDFDRLGNYKVIKPDKDDYRKIDGIVSLLIAAATLVSDKTIWVPILGSILLFERKQPERYGQTSTLSMPNEGTKYAEAT